ncbi:acetyl-CoA carboxylase biotin carboxyl carrier protein [Arenibaculum pallidiluteum]|uniref:acetyl-CoA carboxylase biotin carboxyl carrier protein n=1 Tax=Arenibaculum pallidiluteum TaxID=2812559 RepID=UPI001A956416|nr:acetyl-CoA carboxylase biotin carboxyl carrier protein [Arenibaculum pallidiluteum]
MANFDIDGDLVRKLAGLLEETGLTEIEFAEGEKRIRVTRGGGQTLVAAAPMHAPPPPAAAPAPAASVPVSLAGHPGAVTSPMVGTAYVAAEPGGSPFVKVGDTVKAGQTLIIIEAMKVMNPIKAPKGGTVTQVLISDAQPVEFGEVLMIIE